MTRKQKAENKAHEAEQSPKKAKAESDNGHPNGKSSADTASTEFEEFCKAIKEHLSVEQLREVLESNGLDSSGPDNVVVRRWSVDKFPYLGIYMHAYACSISNDSSQGFS